MSWGLCPGGLCPGNYVWGIMSTGIMSWIPMRRALNSHHCGHSVQISTDDNTERWPQT